MEMGRRIAATTGDTGTVIVPHGYTNQVAFATVTPAIGDNLLAGGVGAFEVFWNTGPYLAVAGTANRNVVITCAPLRSGPVVTTEAAPDLPF